MFLNSVRHKKYCIFSSKSIADMKIMFTFATQKKNRQAQMAESVDALVSNTSGVTSIPVRSRVWVQRQKLSIEKSIT